MKIIRPRNRADFLCVEQKRKKWYNQFDKLEFDGGYIMAGNIVPFLVGVVCIILGISNMRGNISSLHSYHRHRVSEEDRIPFGKQVGLGIIIVGISIIVFSVLSSVTQ